MGLSPVFLSDGAQPSICPIGLSPVFLPDRAQLSSAQPNVCPMGLSPVFLPDGAQLSSVFSRWGSAQCLPERAQLSPVFAQSGSAQPSVCLMASVCPMGLSPMFAHWGSAETSVCLMGLSWAQTSVCPMGLSLGPSIKTRRGHSPAHPSYKQECSHVDPLPLQDTNYISFVNSDSSTPASFLTGQKAASTKQHPLCPATDPPGGDENNIGSLLFTQRSVCPVHLLGV